MSLVASLRRTLAAIVLTLVIAPVAIAPAAADGALAMKMLGFVYSIDASPDWSAEIRGLSVDEADATVRIGSLVVRARSGGLTVDIENAVLTGYTEADDRFAASALEIGHATIATIGTKIEFNRVRFADVGVPFLTALAYDRSKPFSLLIGAYSAIAKMRSSGGQIDEVAVRETHAGQASLITYRNVTFGALADGKLDRASAGPLTMQSPTPDPLAELSVRRAEASGIDLDAFLDVYDPLRYIAGTGDGKWRRTIDRIRYSDVAMTVPSIRLTFGAIAIDGVKLRQPAESFAPLIDATMSERKVTPQAMSLLRSTYLGEFLSSFGVDRFAVNDVALAATGIDQLTLGSFEVTDASSDGIGAITFDDFVAAIAGQGAVQVGRFALGDIVLPPFERYDEAFQLAQRGDDVDVSSLVPQLGSVEAANIHLQAIDFPGLALGRLHADFGNHVGTVPTAIAVNINDLDIATASLPSARVQSLIHGLGYDRIRADAAFDLNWHEADGTVSLDNFKLDIADFGNTTASVLLAGLTRKAIEGKTSSIFDGLLFEKARLSFEDKSVVERSLTMRADLLNVPLDRLKQQLAGALPLMLAFVGDPEKVKQIVPVLQNFIKTPGTLTIEASPKAPVPVAEIETAAHTRPQSLPDLLDISVSGTPGSESGTGDASTSAGDESKATDAPMNHKAGGE